MPRHLRRHAIRCPLVLRDTISMLYAMLLDAVTLMTPLRHFDFRCFTPMILLMLPSMFY